MYGKSTHPMRSMKECYDKVLAQFKSITELVMEGQDVDRNHFDISHWSGKLDYIKVVLNTTNATKDVGNMITC